jgi:hypothetical protein
MSTPEEPREARSRPEGAPIAATFRAQLGTVRPRATTWVERRRSKSLPMDLACTYVERDREQLTAILGSAIALRLFLFMVPTVAMVVAIIVLVFGPGGLEQLLQQASVTAELAQEVNNSTDASTSTLLLTIVTSAWLAAWAGRNLVIVLAACSGTAWRLAVAERRATLRVAGVVTMLVFAIVVTASVTNRLRSDFGIAGSTTSWFVGGIAFTSAWFAVMWVLPKGTPDPGAVIPGAALVGVSLTVLQWFMQFYLPSKLERSSELTGSVGTAVAVLGSMFLIGRVMASSFVVNSVIFERIGSISDPLFALPGVRRLPERFPVLVDWFDLPRREGRAEPPPVTEGEGWPRERP